MQITLDRIENNEKAYEELEKQINEKSCMSCKHTETYCNILKIFQQENDVLIGSEWITSEDFFCNKYEVNI